MRIIKALVLQIYWYLSIVYGKAVYVPMIGLGLFVGDYFLFKKREKLGASYLAFSFTLAIAGYSMDKFINKLGILDWGDQFYPSHLIGIWLIFPTYYYHFFEKFSKSKWLPFIVGGVFGPLAYYSGGNLNSTLSLKTDTLSLFILAFFWGVFFLISVRAFFKFKDS